MNVARSVDSPSAKARARLDHPVIDADSHIVEPDFVLPDYLKEIGGADMVKRMNKYLAEGQTKIPCQGPWWAYLSGSHTGDRVMAMLPRLYAERLDETGIDFAIAHTSMGLFWMNCLDDELRQAACRAINMLNAETFAEVSHRLTPAAVIPAHTPDEALAEIDFAIGELGMKTVMIASLIQRPVPEIVEKAPELALYTSKVFSLGLDSPYDYDPVWAKCRELKVVPAGHSKDDGGGGTRSSATNFMFNHLGAFAGGADYFCRSIFLGGVPNRFPGMNFAFLEGGALWAVGLYNGLFEHWEKRHPAAIAEYYDPHKLDIELMGELFDTYANGKVTGAGIRAKPHLGVSRLEAHPEQLDEWAACGIEKKEDIRDQFANNFYFGCEADDRTVACAFDPKINHLGAKLKAMYSSDIGHWDVLDVTEVFSEAYEFLEDGLLTEEDFRDFTFGNVAEMHTQTNPDFFKGTSVESAVAAEMK